MALARLAFANMPDVTFWKLCGSGSGEGFTPRPNTQVWAILAVWPSPELARKHVESAGVYNRWRARASESLTLYLTPTTARGSWARTTPFQPAPVAGTGPIAALTRATLKPKVLPHFWTRVPDISQAIGQDPNVLFKIGIGEIPWLHQVTFSIWPNAASMAHFARRDGPHAHAIQAVRDGQWFREELYARFAIQGQTGSWGGQPLLAQNESKVS
nr:spheroidene monooxygenase [Phaeobacter sp.]